MKYHKPQYSLAEKRCRLVISLSILLIGITLLAVFDNWSLLGSVIIFSLFPFYRQIFSPARPETVQNMLYLLEVKGQYLRVGIEQIELAKLKRVAIGPLDREYAALQFPFNPQFNAAFSFPIKQLDAVRTWFNNELPQIELVE